MSDMASEAGTTIGSADPRKILNEIYKGKGYFDKYGGSLLMSLLLVVAFVGVIIYLRIMSRLASLRSNWAANRCSPEVMPFAGAIVWKPGQTFLEATSENFNGCLSTIQEEITGAFLEPINYSMSAMGSVAGDIQGDIDLVRSKLNDMGEVLQDALNKVLSQIMSFVVPIQISFMRMKDVLAKTHAVLATSIFSLLSGYLGLKSFLGAFINILIVGLIAATAIILPLIIFIFTWPIAIPMIILYAAVAVPLAVIIGYLAHIVDLTRTTVPKVPGGGVVRACLHRDTLLKMSNETYKRIENIQVGDILKADGEVYAVMKVSTKEMDMYRIGDVIVSGSHSVVLKTGWIYANEHPGAILIPDYPEEYVYCLNTESGVIHVGGLVFSDWNDLDEDEKDFIGFRYNLPIDCITPEYLHEQYDTGYVATTPILMSDGTNKPIADIQPNDMIDGGNRVIASVVLDASEIEEDYSKNTAYKNKVLYSLITKTGLMRIGTITLNTEVADFNWNVEHLLEGYKERE
jgi:hypothetical protein